MTNSALDYLLLFLLSGGPRSGYDLRKQIADSPLRIYSDSPGAIYPALRRLTELGWIDAGRPEGPRRRRTYHVTPQGLAAGVDWLRRPVKRDDVLRGADALLLRFALMGMALSPVETQRFLEQFERETAAHLATLRQYYTRESAGLPPTGRLAFEFGLSDYRGRVRWARRARKVLGARRSSAGKGGRS